MARAAAVMMGLSCLLLAYSAYVVPMQLSFWITDDVCDPFPTLYTDVVVDVYFLVRWRRRMASRVCACVCVYECVRVRACACGCVCV